LSGWKIGYYNKPSSQSSQPVKPASQASQIKQMISIIYLAIIGSLAGIVWSMPFLIFKIIGLSMFIIKNRQKLNILYKHVKLSSLMDDNDNPVGFIIGKYFVGYIGSSDNGLIAYCICTHQQYQLITNYNNNQPNDSNNPAKPKNEKRMIKLYERSGSYNYMYYNGRDLDIGKLIPKDNQIQIIDSIIEYYESHNNAVVFIHGPPGVGKSITAILVASRYQSMFSNTFDPTTPGDKLNYLYTTANPSKERPLIIVIEEVDQMIHRIHNQLVHNPKFLISVTDKNGWNTLLDNIDLGLYPFMILIMTSNHDKNMIDKLDGSYLRPGRLNLEFELK